MAENDLTKENCMEMLRDAYKQLERYPKKSDFTVEEVAAVKSYFGPWPRALEACGILPDRSVEREQQSCRNGSLRKSGRHSISWNVRAD